MRLSSTPWSMTRVFGSYCKLCSQEKQPDRTLLIFAYCVCTVRSIIKLNWNECMQSATKTDKWNALDICLTESLCILGKVICMLEKKINFIFSWST